ncbi:MAG TPA: bile acid:sodium symporter [Pseudolabrys sp.]|nr:bile acid:sodium symporter [Pseudolabrys sp.]
MATGMLKYVVDLGVPAGIFVLMLIAGTEMAVGDFARLLKHPRPVLIGAFGQLVVLPPLSFLVAVTSGLNLTVSTAVLLIALCPGGPISNNYCYLARCNVSLSATITAIGTLLCLASIPLWLNVMSGSSAFDSALLYLSASKIIAQLMALMILPIALGMTLAWAGPQLLENRKIGLRLASFAIIFALLLATLWAVRDQALTLARDILLAAAFFILGAMLLGQMMGYGMKPKERPVLVIESAVRNIGVAFIVGRGIFDEQSFAKFVAFLTGYFIVEVVVMIPYTQLVRARLAGRP